MQEKSCIDFRKISGKFRVLFSNFWLAHWWSYNINNYKELISLNNISHEVIFQCLEKLFAFVCTIQKSSEEIQNDNIYINIIPSDIALSNINLLPPECIINISLHFNVRDLFKTRTLNKKFSQSYPSNKFWRDKISVLLAKSFDNPFAHELKESRFKILDFWKNGDYCAEIHPLIL